MHKIYNKSYKNIAGPETSLEQLRESCIKVVKQIQSCIKVATKLQSCIKVIKVTESPQNLGAAFGRRPKGGAAAFGRRPTLWVPSFAVIL